MSDDHLSNEISVSAELTPTGVKASAKSRTLSAIDRLVASALDRFGPKLEGPAAIARSKNAREVRIQDALTDRMVEMIHTDPSLAERALENHLGSIGRRQVNKEAVVTLALEDLTESPPSEEQSHAGPEVLDDAFLNRFERYAEDASSAQLRERWARVLSAEVRAPGTFSAKVMRTVDEMDTSTAALFERICESRLDDCIPKAILPKVNYMEQTRLVSTGLVVEPELGQVRLGYTANDASGKQIKMIPFGSATIGIVAGEGFTYPKMTEPLLQDHEGRPAMSIWLLTDVGHAISSILPSGEKIAFDRLLDSMADYLIPGEVRDYRLNAETQTWVQVKTVSRSREPEA